MAEQMTGFWFFTKNLCSAHPSVFPVSFPLLLNALFNLQRHLCSLEVFYRQLLYCTRHWNNFSAHLTSTPSSNSVRQTSCCLLESPHSGHFLAKMLGFVSPAPAKGVEMSNTALTMRKYLKYFKVYWVSADHIMCFSRSKLLPCKKCSCSISKESHSSGSTVSIPAQNEKDWSCIIGFKA